MQNIYLIGCDTLKVKIIFILSFIAVVAIYFLMRTNSITASNTIALSNMEKYNSNYLDRYLDYKRQNKNLSNQEIINHVNIGIDYPFYTNIRITEEEGYTTLVNKYTKLSNNYRPNDLYIVDEEYNPNLISLRKQAAIMFVTMAEDAKLSGLTIIIESGFRSYSYQKYLYSKYKDMDGIKKADTYSARAGHSEHQLGLVIDIRNADLPYEMFEKTKEFIWMQKNAYKYGFILRYPEGKEKITGYSFESWHYRYVGRKISTDMFINYPVLTYDEYYVQFLK
ncbi:MAG TPA: M15 family metallopeptidase [Bacilli bacterium]|nr:M15 family metallopeptidase [Bacilli bacterium]